MIWRYLQMNQTYLQIVLIGWLVGCLKIQVARPGIEPRSCCSASQELLKPLGHHCSKIVLIKDIFKWIKDIFKSFEDIFKRIEDMLYLKISLIYLKISSNNLRWIYVKTASHMNVVHHNYILISLLLHFLNMEWFPNLSLNVLGRKLWEISTVIWSYTGV